MWVTAAVSNQTTSCDSMFHCGLALVADSLQPSEVTETVFLHENPSTVLSDLYSLSKAASSFIS